VGHIVHCDASEAQNVKALFFVLGRDQYGFDQIFIRTRYAELLFLHPVRSVGHVVHSSASGLQNADILFFMLGWDQYGSHNSVLEHITPNMCFCIRWDMRVT
jgi:hypothetical protein